MASGKMLSLEPLSKSASTLLAERQKNVLSFGDSFTTDQGIDGVASLHS